MIEKRVLACAILLLSCCALFSTAHSQDLRLFFSGPGPLTDTSWLRTLPASTGMAKTADTLDAEHRQIVLVKPVTIPDVELARRQGRVIRVIERRDPSSAPKGWSELSSAIRKELDAQFLLGPAKLLESYDRMISTLEPARKDLSSDPWFRYLESALRVARAETRYILLRERFDEPAMQVRGYTSDGCPPSCPCPPHCPLPFETLPTYDEAWFNDTRREIRRDLDQAGILAIPGPMTGISSADQDTLKCTVAAERTSALLLRAYLATFVGDPLGSLAAEIENCRKEMYACLTGCGNNAVNRSLYALLLEYRRDPLGWPEIGREMAGIRPVRSDSLFWTWATAHAFLRAADDPKLTGEQVRQSVRTGLTRLEGLPDSVFTPWGCYVRTLWKCRLALSGDPARDSLLTVALADSKKLRGMDRSLQCSRLNALIRSSLLGPTSKPKEYAPVYALWHQAMLEDPIVKGSPLYLGYLISYYMAEIDADLKAPLRRELDTLLIRMVAAPRTASEGHYYRAMLHFADWVLSDRSADDKLIAAAEEAKTAWVADSTLAWLVDGQRVPTEHGIVTLLELGSQKQADNPSSHPLFLSVATKLYSEGGQSVSYHLARAEVLNGRTDLAFRHLEEARNCTSKDAFDTPCGDPAWNATREDARCKRLYDCD